MNINTERFIAGQNEYFTGSYERFAAFGGPSVYFHRECLAAGREAFLSTRHVELLYATLTAWGMHRMGDSEKTKTKLTDWERFRASLLDHASDLGQFTRYRLLEMSDAEYTAAILALRPHYSRLDLSESDATVVANSKALFHLFPEFIPPIDRQYTIRFFQKAPEQWLDGKGRFRAIQLPAPLDDQFDLFHMTCLAIKHLASRVDSRLLGDQHRQHSVTPPKALDNAIVNYVRIVSRRAAGGS
jgi:hypothetical protein